MFTNLPVLFIIFNRPEIAIRSFKSIRTFRPKQVFIACDGPRIYKLGEQTLVTKTRNIILNAIDWDCNVQTLFQDKNIGCGLGVYTAINWFFENVEYGVILEDDCIAQQSFFKYAYEMLNRYKDDERIGMIAGTNPISSNKNSYSIIFSKYKSCWGWGTWKRSWKNMDLEMSWRKTVEANNIIHNCGYKGKDVDIWKYKLKCIDKCYVSAWDWQWYFSLSAQNQLCIYPKYNQISNIGDDVSATHTSFSDITIPSKALKFPLVIPKYIAPNASFDRRFYNQSSTLFARLSRMIPHKLKILIKSILAKCLK